MNLFKKLFGSRKLKITDSDFGEIESVSKNGKTIIWLAKSRVYNTEIEIYLKGDQSGILQKQKNIILNVLKNEPQILSKSEKAIREHFENAEIEFISIEKDFYLDSISVIDIGFEISFFSKRGHGCFFNVHFENNKRVAISIDG